VALVEKADFCSGASANSLKIIHGGLRYLQHADFKRMRESICERTTLMRIAPHLVHPLPVLMPAYGCMTQNKAALYIALAINDLISSDRNRLEDPEKHIPRGRVLSTREVQNAVPGVDSKGLTGGMLFGDAQVYNSERLTLAFIKAAANTGACLANYLEVTDLLKDSGRVTGATVRDVLTGDRFDIRARAVVNATGAWVNRLLAFQKRCGPCAGVRFAKAFNVVTRPIFKEHAVGIKGARKYCDADAVINKGARYLFVAPWRDRAIIGTNYQVYEGNPDYLRAQENEIQDFLDEVNRAYPPAGLRMEDVSFIHIGLVPISGEKRADVQLAKHSQILDHEEEGLKGLFSMVGVKYTTARREAERILDRIFALRGQKAPESKSAVTPLYGGQITRFNVFMQKAIEKNLARLGEGAVRQLVYNHGSAYPEVLQYLDVGCKGSPDRQGVDPLLGAEVLYSLHHEMAQKLGDVVFRRTELGSAGYPGDEKLNGCAEIMGTQLGWSRARVQQELAEVNETFLLCKGNLT
jgi:glycerol-3-phosphate dehydrogenase